MAIVPVGSVGVPVNVGEANVAITVVSTDSVFADFVIPVPAVICPAPENCVNVREVVSSVIASFVVSTYPISALTVPSETKTYIPVVTLAEVLASVDLDAAPDATTT